MPIVGTGKEAKHYSYGKKGRAAAAAEAKKTGQEVKTDPEAFKAYLMKRHGGKK